MEDFNTSTLPHKKYYDLDAYERRRAAKAAKKGPSAVRPHWRHGLMSVMHQPAESACLDAVLLLCNLLRQPTSADVLRKPLNRCVSTGRARHVH